MYDSKELISVAKTTFYFLKISSLDFPFHFRCKGGECFDVFPQLDASIQKPAPSEKKKAFANFLYGLSFKQKHHKCEDYIFIMYFADQKQVHTFASTFLGTIYTYLIDVMLCN